MQAIFSTLFWVEKRGGKSGEFEEDLETSIKHLYVID
jgi:hypothetical protein